MKGLKGIIGDKQKEIALLDSIDQLMEIQNKHQYEVLRDLKLDSRVIGKLRHKHNRQLKHRNSYVIDRITYCVMIEQGRVTPKEVSEMSGYSLTSVYSWLNAFRNSKENMLYKSVVYKG